MINTYSKKTKSLDAAGNYELFKQYKENHTEELKLKIFYGNLALVRKFCLEYEKTLIDKNKQEKLNEIINLGSKQRIALLCFEKDQKYCHRGVIANYLRKKGFEVKDL